MQSNTQTAGKVGRTALDRFLQIKNYNNPGEIRAWLKDESEKLGGEIPNRYEDMLALSMLSDVYYTNVSEDIRNKLTEENGIDYGILTAIDCFRIAESRMVAIANWGDITIAWGEADRTRQYIWNLMEEYHANGWDMHVSSVYMEEGEPDEQGFFSKDEDDSGLDEFKADYLGILGEIFNNVDEELTLQLFFTKEGQPSQALVLVNCLWNVTPDGFEECTAGPFVISGKDTEQMKYIVPENIGIPVLGI